MKRIYIPFVLLLASSCVPMKQYNNLKDDYKSVSDEERNLLQDNRELKESNTEISASFEKLKSDNEDAAKRISTLLSDKNQLEEELNRLRKSYGEFPDASTMNSEEIRNLLKKVRDANLELIEREKRFNQSESKRKEEQQKLFALEEALKKKDAAVNALKRKVSDALLGFEKDGLSVKIKNGKVYVSVEDKLLFKSGSWTVGNNGKKALRKLANVIARNKEINIMVEGHTDDVPYKGNKYIKDNWDLSVKRSTAIIRIILENKSIQPKRLIASGRSKYVPLMKGKSSYSRARNRRTEIILTPKLDEVFKILGN